MSNRITRCCEPKTIVQNSVAHIQRCDHCGCISLHLGHVTLRLDESAVVALWSALGQAVSTMNRPNHDTGHHPTIGGMA
jgi:hypothetical protein